MRTSAIRSIGLLAIAVSQASFAFALPKETSFAVDGPNYVAEAGGTGATEPEAQNDALRAAIGVIMESLGKDRLFSELFLKNPPVTMEWKKLSSSKGVSSWTVRLRLVVDDESLRLLYNASYVSTVSTMLDGAEQRLSDAERLGADARKAETDGQLGRAMSLYWQARDACDSGLDLLKPLGDAAVFSTFGKKKAPELREVLSAIRSTVVSGYERIRSAEQGLASDEDLSSALASLADIDKAVSGAEAWSTGIAARAARLEATPKAELRAFSDELAAKYRILSDSRLALGRVEDTVPKTKEILSARIDVVRRRIDGTSAYIKKTKSAVDTEIRDPAIARAKRAQNIRWAFLHEPSGALALRLFSPFGLDPSSNEIAFVDTGRFEFSLRAEGAFGGDKGVWIASSIEKDDAVLASLAADDGLAKNTGYSQFVDLGFYGRGLFGAGFSWDWLRQVDGDSALKRSAVRVFAGGMDEADERAAWLIALSWEFPYDMDEFAAANILNAGLEGFLRMGKVVELNAGLALRPRANGDNGYDASFRYSAGAGLRLPPPFMWGIEFSGYAVKTIGGAPEGADSYVRMFIEYSL